MDLSKDPLFSPASVILIIILGKMFLAVFRPSDSLLPEITISFDLIIARDTSFFKTTSCVNSRAAEIGIPAVKRRYRLRENLVKSICLARFDMRGKDKKILNRNCF